MSYSLRHTVEAAVLSKISAALFAGFFRLNELIFSGLEHSQGVNWIFLPAGFRVLLVFIRLFLLFLLLLFFQISEERRQFIYFFFKFFFT